MIALKKISEKKSLQHSLIIAHNRKCCRQMRILFTKSFHSSRHKQVRSTGAVLLLTVPSLYCSLHCQMYRLRIELNY